MVEYFFFNKIYLQSNLILYNVYTLVYTLTFITDNEIEEHEITSSW